VSGGTELVRLTIVGDEFAAETIIALLKTEGIDSIQQKTDVAAGMADASASAFGPREVLVRSEDLERARDLIDED
jgi:Putative prokaryotic signal transducing protein